MVKSDGSRRLLVVPVVPIGRVGVGDPVETTGGAANGVVVLANGSYTRCPESAEVEMIPELGQGLNLSSCSLRVSTSLS